MECAGVSLKSGPNVISPGSVALYGGCQFRVEGGVRVFRKKCPNPPLQCNTLVTISPSSKSRHNVAMSEGLMYYYIENNGVMT